MMIYSFGSGFSLESEDPEYLEQVASDIAYAHRLGIEVGHVEASLARAGGRVRPGGPVEESAPRLDGRPLRILGSFL